MKKVFDVWECLVNGRVSYRATEQREDNSLRPDVAINHIDTVVARSKREAVSKAVREKKRVLGG